MAQIMGLRAQGTTHKTVHNVILKYKDLYQKLRDQMDPLWAITALRKTLAEESGAKASELAAPMFVVYDTAEEANQKLPDRGLSTLLKNLERRAEEAARDGAKRGTGGQEDKGGGGRDANAWAGQHRGGRYGRRNRRGEQGQYTEQSHATEQGRSGQPTGDQQWCNHCNKYHVGGTDACWTQSWNILATAPEHIRNRVVAGLTGKGSGLADTKRRKGRRKGRQGRRKRAPEGRS